jgi:hypothetical protein
MREFNKAILRVTYKREWDPVRNDWKYVNRDDGTEMLRKPYTLRNDLWDVNEVSDWTIGHVSIILPHIYCATVFINIYAKLALCVCIVTLAL